MLACKHNEIDLFPLRSFLRICDNAYTAHEILASEAHLLLALDVHLHLPTTHDHLLPMLQSFGAAPSHALACTEPWPTSDWCDCLAHIGLGAIPVATAHPRALARALATLGALLSTGVAPTHIRHKTIKHRIRPPLHQRACFLQEHDDWTCLEALLDALQHDALHDRRSLAPYTELKPLETVLASFFSQNHPPPPTRLNHNEVRAHIERHYPQWADIHLKCFFNRNWIIKAFQEVTIDGRNVAIDEQLHVTRLQHLQLDDVDLLPSRTGLHQCMMYSATDIAAAASNNVWMHFRKRVDGHVKWVHRLPRSQWSALTKQQKKARLLQLTLITRDMCRMPHEAFRSEPLHHDWVASERARLGIDAALRDAGSRGASGCRR